MNFSELVPYQNAVYSHNGDYLAISKDKRLFVSRARSPCLLFAVRSTSQVSYKSSINSSQRTRS